MQVCLLPRCLHSGSSETSQISLPRDPHLTECEHHSLDAQGRRLRVSSGSSLSHPRLPHRSAQFSYEADPSSTRVPALHCGGRLQDPIISPLAWAGVFLPPPPPPPPSHPLRSQAESDHTVFLLGSAFLPAANRKEAKILNLVKICALPPLPSAGTTLLLLASWAPRSPWDQHGPLLAPTRLQGRAPIAYPSHSPLSSAPMMLAGSS